MNDRSRRWPDVERILDALYEEGYFGDGGADAGSGAGAAGLERYLDRACGGDAELRAEVEAIVAADRAAEGFLQAPAAAGLSWSLGAASAQGGARPSARVGSEIGPYRLLREVGHGGMGEVYEAYDSRLDRSVALKRVRFGALEGDRGATAIRHRFRREARLAAGLSHPAIVRIHDLLEWQGEDWLVMELLEGVTLAEQLADGPLMEARALELSEQIAGALAAAHEAGILHRDLKSENVLVTPEGQAKLLDFGLAKRVDVVLPGDPSPAATAAPVTENGLAVDGEGLDAGLTRVGQLLGTLRALSPEQVAGLPLDARSDLFSFGTLLYEMVTGVSPFVGSGPQETLQAICHQRQVPARERVPAVSRRLSAWIDRLLAKAPEERPQSARQVAAVLARCARSLSRWRTLAAAVAVLTVAAVLAAAVWMHREPPPPRYVAVAEPTLSGSGVAGAELMAAGVFAAQLRTLSQLRGLAALPMPGSQEGSGDGSEGASTVERARDLGADEALTARLDCPAERCQLVLSRIAADDGRVLWLGNIEVPLDDLALLETAVSSRLREAFSGFAPRPGALPSVPHVAYGRYLRLSQAFQHHQPPTGEALLAELADLRRAQPDFLEPYLLEAEAARARFIEARDPRWMEHGLELLRQAEELAPGDRRVPEYLFDLAQESDRWELAAAALKRLAALEPGGAAALQREAELLAHQGRGEEALERMRRAAERRPALHHLFNLALMEYQQGEVAAATQTLQALLERAPEDFSAAAFLAQIELLAGSPQRAVKIYERLLEQDRSASLLINLGTAYLLIGSFAQAEAQFTAACELEPAHAVAALNLADAVLLLGRREDAEDHYRRTLELVATDPALPPWQRLTVRAQALAHLGQTGAALAAAREALAVAPDNPNVALETALVMVLAGEPSAAVDQVERALGMGLDRRWFQLPWFAPLADHPRLRQRLGVV